MSRFPFLLLSILVVHCTHPDTHRSAAASEGPRLGVEERIHDYGVLYHGEAASVSHTFILVNEGDETLVITGTHPSCGCTRADLSHQRLEPGEVGTLTAELGFEQYTGKDQVRVTITSNDSTTPSLDLGLQGFVIRRWSLEPKELDAGVLAASTTSGLALIKITAQRKMEEALPRILSVDQDSDRIQATLLSETERTMQNRYLEKTWTYQVQVQAGDSFSEQEAGTLRFLTDCPLEPQLSATVQWKVEGDLEVAPRSLTLLKSKYFHAGRLTSPTGPPEGADRGRIRVRSRSKEPVEITNLSITSPFLASVAPGETPDVKWIEVSMGTEDTGTYSAILSLWTNNPNERQFDIIVQGEVQAQKPILGVIPDYHHFGKVFADIIPEATHVFSVRNSGNRPLEVSLDAPPTVDAELGRDLIPAGSHTTLVVRKSLAGLLGQVDEVLTLHSNDPDRPTAAVTLRGEVLPRWRLDPPELLFPNTVRGRTEVGKVRVEQWFSSWERPNDPVAFSSENPGLRVEVGTTDQAFSGLGYATAETEILVHLDPDGKVGWNEHTLDLKFSRGSEHPIPPLVVKWEILGNLRSLPRRLVFSKADLSPSEPSGKQIKIYTLDGAPFETTDFKAPEGMSLRKLESKTGECFFEVKVEDPNKLPPNPRLTFGTNLPEEPEYQVEILLR